LLSLLFLLFPLFFFATHGTLVGEVCCESNPFSLYVIYQQFAPTSLIIGLFFLAFFFTKPIKNLKKSKDYFLFIFPFIITLAVLLFMIISSIQYSNNLSKFRDCTNQSIEWRSTGGFENIDQATNCLKENNIDYKLNIFGDQLEFKGPTNYFPYLIQ